MRRLPPDPMPPAAPADAASPAPSPPTPAHPPWNVGWKRLLLPPLAAGAALLTVALALEPRAFVHVAEMMALYLLTPVGQEAWLLLGHNRFGFAYWEIALLLFGLNAVFALFFCYSVPYEALVARLGFLGRRIRRFERRVHDSRAARRSVEAGLFVVLLLPFHSGGSILGSLAGRSLGLDWKPTFVAVMAAIGIRFAAALLLVYGYLSVWG